MSSSSSSSSTGTKRRAGARRRGGGSPKLTSFLLLLLVLVCVFIFQHTLHQRSSSSRKENSSISISSKNKKVKACQPLPLEKIPTKICNHVQKHCHLDGHINYLTSYYCSGISPSHPNQVILRTRIAVLAATLAWLLFLFSSVGLAASDFFSPNLSTLAARLHLSESTAGVSLLAFGNGSPDVFSTFAAMRSGSGSLAIGELIGAASFITAVVAAAMMLIQPFRVKPYPFLRDVGFFTVAIALALFVLLDGTLHLIESLALVALYITYAAIVIIGSWWQERRRLRRLAERTGLPGGAKETRPSVIEAGFHHAAPLSPTNKHAPPPSADVHKAPSLLSQRSSTHHSLRLQIPQTPLHHRCAPSAASAGAAIGAGSTPAHHIPLPSSSPLATPLSTPAAARIRSEYEPDADDEQGDTEDLDDESDATRSQRRRRSKGGNYANEPDPFDRAVALTRGIAVATAIVGAGALPPPPPPSGAAATPQTAALPQQAGTFPPPGPSVDATNGPAASSTPATIAAPGHPQPSQQQQQRPLRPGYYLPRHSLLGAIEFRNVVRSLQAESAAATAALLLPPTSTARTPGGYYADEDDEGGGRDGSDLDPPRMGRMHERRRSEGGSLGRSASQSQARAAAAHARGQSASRNSLLGSFGLAASASAMLDGQPDREDDEEEARYASGSLSASGSVAHRAPATAKSRGFLSSLGFRQRRASANASLPFAAAGETSDEGPRGGGGARHSFFSATKGPSKSKKSSSKQKAQKRWAGSGGGPAAPASGAAGVAMQPSASAATLPLPAGTTAAAAAGAGPGTDTRLPATTAPILDDTNTTTHNSLAVPLSAVLGTPRDRGWELFYSRGLELESDWDRLASPAGAVGAAADRSREAMRAHLLAAHPHGSGIAAGGGGGGHHRSDSTATRRSRRSAHRHMSKAPGSSAEDVFSGGGGAAAEMGRSASAIEGSKAHSKAGTVTAALPRLKIPASSSSAIPAGAAVGKLVDVGDAAQAGGVPSITVDTSSTSRRNGAVGEQEHDSELTPRPVDDGDPGDAEGDSATTTTATAADRVGPRTRTLSASTMLSADEEEEQRGVRMRTTSRASEDPRAHPQQPLSTLHGTRSKGTTDRKPAHRGWSLRRLRHATAQAWDHAVYDLIEPIAGALFPSLRHFGSKSLVGILVSILSAPAILVLKLTLPVVVDEEKEADAAAAELDRKDAAAAAARGSGRSGSENGARSQRRRRGPVHLEGEERPLLAENLIAPPMPLAADQTTPAKTDANAHVAAGLKSLQTHPETPFAHLSGSNVGQTRDDDADGSSDAGSYDSFEEEQDALAFFEREERKRRTTASSFLALAQLSLGPTFCTWAILSPESTSLQDPAMHTVLRVFGMATALALLCSVSLLFSSRDFVSRRPALRRMIGLVRCLGGFVVSVLFIMTIVDEVVSILQAIGIIMGLSDAILGLTIFAMGNSLGDLVANVTIARMGHPVMAISACFAGPLLNILLGIGLSGTYILTSDDKIGTGQANLVLDFSPTLLVSCIGLLVILVGILIAVPLNGFYLDRKLGTTLIMTYAVIMCINVLTEIFVDKK